ncbi:lanthionine synthetase C family protein [Bacillus mobilis]|uniref:lanthionine synthetase C family protein n=1 Tax=Bacillus mobilis TaxID=2026190 RepID=UPI002E2408D9|nr:lanthionine synthetase C family protein [Bacillus mobilis]
MSDKISIGSKCNNKLVIETILSVAKKCSIPEAVKSIVSQKENSMYIPWSELAMSSGYPSLCMLYGELDNMYPNDGWDLIGHTYMVKIQKLINENGVNSISTFSGLAGIGYAARALSRDGERYQNFIRSINNILINYVDKHMDEIEKKIELGNYISDYDVIEGLTGIGRYLLLFKDHNAAYRILTKILNYLIRLAGNIVINNSSIPAWFIPNQNLSIAEERDLYSNGLFNCSLSHGIAGPLALLSIAYTHEVRVSGQKEAIIKISDWLISKSDVTDSGIYFSDIISLEDEINGTKKIKSLRDSWCYGAPGILRSLWLASLAIDDAYVAKFSLSGWETLFTVRKSNWGLDSPTFCHGLSGFFHINNLMIKENKAVEFLDVQKQLLHQLISSYSDKSPFGFQDIEFNEQGIYKMNKVGLIDGSTGIALSLIAYVNQRSKTAWDTMFLLN